MRRQNWLLPWPVSPSNVSHGAFSLLARSEPFVHYVGLVLDLELNLQGILRSLPIQHVHPLAVQ